MRKCPVIVLDTHVLVWWASGDAELSSAAAQAIDETLANSEDVIVSCISAWEIAVKTFTGGDRAALEERFFNAHRDLAQADQAQSMAQRLPALAGHLRHVILVVWCLYWYNLGVCRI